LDVVSTLFFRTLSQGLQAFAPVAVARVWCSQVGDRRGGTLIARAAWLAALITVPASWWFQRSATRALDEAALASAALAIAIATKDGGSGLDVGRAMQNMLLVAWNDGVVSCPNGMPDAAAAARVLGLEDGLLPVNIPSFGYPARPLTPEDRSAEEWSTEANRKPLEEVVRRPRAGTQ